MFLCYTLLRHTFHLQLLPFPQLAYDRSLAVRIDNHRCAHELICSLLAHHQVPRIDSHDSITRTTRPERQRDTTSLAVLLTVAVARVQNLVDVPGAERDETESVRDELIGEHRRVGFDLDKVDSNGGDFGEDNAAEGVREGEVDVAKDKVNGAGIDLARFLVIFR